MLLDFSSTSKRLTAHARLQMVSMARNFVDRDLNSWVNAQIENYVGSLTVNES